jgi:phosphoserine phosphatase RsbU/P
VGQYTFWKESYVTYFPPLGWYVASSVYKDDIEEPARRIIRWEAAVGAVVLLISILLALLLVRRMTIRLQLLTSYAQELSSSDFSLADDIQPRMKEISRTSQDEVGKLAKAFAFMIQALVDHIRRLKETTALKEKIESELRIAHNIQMSMVPHPPELKGDGFELYAALEPAKEVGGDLYDFFQVDEDHLGLIIGDVSDKGVPAALFMSKSKTLLRLLATATDDGLRPSSLLTRANKELCFENELTMFVTLFYGILDLKTGELRYASAGHNPPLVVADGGVARLPVEPGLPLGAMDDVEFVESRRDFKPGELLLLYTDGVSEALDASGQFFTEARLAGLLDQYTESCATAEDVIRHVVSAVKDYSTGAIQSDDITLLCVKYLGTET